MERIYGKSVFAGIAIGKLAVYKKETNSISCEKVSDTDTEIKRWQAAKETAKEQLKDLYQTALAGVGRDNAKVFEVHRMMLDDPDFVGLVEDIIRSREVCAEYAVAYAGEDFSRRFEASEDEYMRGRAADLLDITDRVVRVLSGLAPGGFSATEPVILLADDLAPSETARLDKSWVLSFVTRRGSANSHTAILARAMSIPALVGADFSDELDGKTAIVDGFSGELIIEPDKETLRAYENKKAELCKYEASLSELKGKENITLDGKKVDIYANIGSVADVAEALENDAGGIGLFRSEFLYLKSDTWPTEDEQFQTYRTVAEKMAGKKVIIRTLDIGADKQVDYFKLAKEDNPAMGYRAIRICLDRIDIFKTQLRALYRASYYGNIAIVFPMIISVDEVKKIKSIVSEVKRELTDQGISYGQVELGIMIETPAAVWMSEELAHEVDFFSIGTNDLTQYTLAIDRQNHALDNICDTHHPAILKAIRTTVENGHKGGARVGICGELGADTSLTADFLRMGVDELSVSPSLVLSVRDAVRKTDLSK